jgi:hypothetical protein
MGTVILRRRIYVVDYFSYWANVGIGRYRTDGRWFDSPAAGWGDIDICHSAFLSAFPR